MGYLSWIELILFALLMFLSGFFSSSETSAQNVMTPLIDVKAIERGITCGEAVRFADENAHVRLPVYEERVDRVIGVRNILELLIVDPEEPIEPYIRQVRYVPGGVSVKDLLLDLRHDGDTLAIVVDEYGGAEGLVTVEDIMEKVVEEMEDEYDEDEKSQQWVKKINTITKGTPQTIQVIRVHW